MNGLLKNYYTYVNFSNCHHCQLSKAGKKNCDFIFVQESEIFFYEAIKIIAFATLFACKMR